MRRRLAIGAAVTAWGVTAGYIGASLAAPVRADTPQIATPGTVMVDVRSMELTDSIVARGEIVPTGVDTFTARSFGPDAVVTRLPPAAGTELRPGAVAIEVSGRPVFALAGQILPYRDITPGSNGPDIAQLQMNLSASGFRTDHDEAGVFGPSTRQAVVDWYRSAGYQALRAPASAPTPGAAPQDEPGAQVDPDPTWIEVPKTELLVSPSLPATVLGTSAGIGTRAVDDTPLLSFGTTATVIRADVNSADSASASRANRIHVDSDDGRFTAECMVGPSHAPGPTPSSVPQPMSSPQSPGTTTPSADAVAPNDAQWLTCTPPAPYELSGSSVRIRFTTTLTDGPVLAVPSSAIRTATDGSATVEVRRHGRTSTIGVTVGAEAGGWVAVSTVGPARLAVGEKVVATPAPR